MTDDNNIQSFEELYARARERMEQRSGTSAFIKVGENTFDQESGRELTRQALLPRKAPSDAEAERRTTYYLEVYGPWCWQRDAAREAATPTAQELDAIRALLPHWPSGKRLTAERKRQVDVAREQVRPTICITLEDFERRHPEWANAPSPTPPDDGWTPSPDFRPPWLAKPDKPVAETESPVIARQIRIG